MSYDDFKEWRAAARDTLPDVASRVFALRGKPYAGHGFHYAMEAQLGRWIINITVPNPLRDLDEEQQKAVRLSWPVLYETFLNSIKDAERTRL